MTMLYRNDDMQWLRKQSPSPSDHFKKRVRKFICGHLT
jgi:hypothetical protein